MELTGSLAPTGAKMKAEVKEDHVVFRGAVKAEVPFEEIAAEARGTLLVLAFRGMVVSLGAGARAPQLAARVRSPPSWLDRLGVPHGATAAVAGPLDAPARAEFAARADLVAGTPRKPVDLLLFAVEGAAALEMLPKLVPLVAGGGALLVVHPEGVPEERVLAAARASGLAVSTRSRFPGSRRALRLSCP